VKILVTSPYARDSLHGNTVTAKRLVSIFKEAGRQAEVIAKGEIVQRADVLIALHARKSVAFIDEYLALCPEGKVIVYLTGTDLYDDFLNGCQVCRDSMSRADALVVSQKASLRSLPEEFRGKTSVIHTSIELPNEIQIKQADLSEVDEDLFVIASHLRAVKQPWLAAEALFVIKGWNELKLRLLGNEVDAESVDRVREWQRKESRFRWLGPLGYAETLSLMQCALATINTSLLEGGANSVCESIVLGVPVLASRIEGNVGLLGDDYLGYFSPHCADELAELMYRVKYNDSFREQLKKQINVRSELFSRQSESKNWLEFILEVL